MSKPEVHREQEGPAADPVEGGPVDATRQEEAVAADLSQDQTGQAGEADQETPAKPLTDQEQIEQLQQELGQINARLLRVSADYQNFIRRAELNLVDAREQQTLTIAKALVPVFDHFDRAMTVDSDKATVTSLLEGVRIVRDELLRTLERFGIERLDVKIGEEFDPNRHQALMRQASDDVAVNHVVEQLQPGYLLAEKVLRAAQVIVATEPTEQPTDEDQASTEPPEGDSQDVKP